MKRTSALEVSIHAVEPVSMAVGGSGGICGLVAAAGAGVGAGAT
jgi:hypothetical protein